MLCLCELYLSDAICKCYTPILIGSVRAFGCGTNTLVFTKLFPSPTNQKRTSTTPEQPGHSEKKLPFKKSKTDGSPDFTTYFFTEVRKIIVSL